MGQEHVAAYGACGVEVVRINGAILSIASPDESHATYIQRGHEMGALVFCEKPICRNLGDLWRIGNGTAVAQNFPLRHQPCFTDIDINSLGEIYRIDAAYNWGRTHKLFEGWRAEDLNYSLVMGGLIHMVDLVLWLTGLDLEVVSAIGCNKSAPGFPNYDTVTALCRLSNGGLCNLTVDGGTGVWQHSHSLRIHGTKGAVNRKNKDPTDKQACIKEFVKNIRDGKPPERDFRATEICLQIEKAASISADR